MEILSLLFYKSICILPAIFPFTPYAEECYAADTRTLQVSRAQTYISLFTMNTLSAIDPICPAHTSRNQSGMRIPVLRHAAHLYPMSIPESQPAL